VTGVLRQRSRPPSTLTGQRFGDFAHSHRTSGQTTRRSIHVRGGMSAKNLAAATHRGPGQG